MERNEALSVGAIKYNTGKPCKNGHMSDRYAKSGACADCLHSSVKKSNGHYITMGDFILAHMKLIYLFVQDKNLPIIKLTVDCFVSVKFPEVNPDHLNPFPFSPVKQAPRAKVEGISKIRVRVPLGYVDEMYAIGDSLLRLAAPILPPTPGENWRYFGANGTQDDQGH